MDCSWAPMENENVNNGVGYESVAGKRPRSEEGRMDSGVKRLRIQNSAERSAVDEASFGPCPAPGGAWDGGSARARGAPRAGPPPVPEAPPRVPPFEDGETRDANYEAMNRYLHHLHLERSHRRTSL